VSPAEGIMNILYITKKQGHTNTLEKFGICIGTKITAK
jgi:hypothetical protein